jgi:hypothetical protein
MHAIAKAVDGRKGGLRIEIEYLLSARDTEDRLAQNQESRLRLTLHLKENAVIAQ